MRKDIEELLSQMPTKDAQTLQENPTAPYLEQVNRQLPPEEHIVSLTPAVCGTDPGAGWESHAGVLVLTGTRILFWRSAGTIVVPFSAVTKMIPKAASPKKLFHSAESAELHVWIINQGHQDWYLHATTPDWANTFVSAARDLYDQYQIQSSR